MVSTTTTPSVSLSRDEERGLFGRTMGLVAVTAARAGTDVIRSMAERARATITEVDASHVVMMSHPDVVADVIRTAAAATEAGA